MCGPFHGVQLRDVRRFVCVCERERKRARQRQKQRDEERDRDTEKESKTERKRERKFSQNFQQIIITGSCPGASPAANLVVMCSNHC